MHISAPSATRWETIIAGLNQCGTGRCSPWKPPSSGIPSGISHSCLMISRSFPMCSHCFPYIFPIYFPICSLYFPIGSLYFLRFSNCRRRVPPAPGSLPWWVAPRASAASALWALKPVTRRSGRFYPAISPGFMRTIWGFVSKTTARSIDCDGKK